MSTIIFLYKEKEILIQCTQNEKLESIIQRFCIKAQVERNDINFLLNDKTLEGQLTEDQISVNEENKKIIIVYDKNNDDSKKCVIVESKDIICPECHESTSISINDNYKISIKNCKNGHKKENMLISEFELTQKIDITKIICANCKINNMNKMENHEFYRCINCKEDLCPSCKNKEHDSKHIIINYEKKNYICDEHGEAYIYYCDDCKNNICYSCEKHNNHKKIDFGFRKNKNDLENELNQFKDSIDRVKQIVNLDINNYTEKWNKVINNYEIIYNIKKNIFVTIEKSLRNLQNVLNQEFIIK